LIDKHESKITDNGQGEFDFSKTKDVREAGGGRRSAEDSGDIDDKDENEGENDDKE
jgi:hypothetical protein